MSAGRYDFRIEQGTTVYRTFTITTNGAAWDLSTFSGRMQVRPTAQADDVFLSLTTEAGDITLSDEGVVTVSIDADTTAGILAGSHVYDFEVESAGGEVWRVLEGRFVVKAEVTR